MRDQSYYTSEGIIERVRELRAMREILTDEEARLIMLKEAADYYKGPVDSRGRRWGKTKSKPNIPGIERQKLAIQEAITTGYHVSLPEYQEIYQ